MEILLPIRYPCLTSGFIRVTWPLFRQCSRNLKKKRRIFRQRRRKL